MQGEWSFESISLKYSKAEVANQIQNNINHWYDINIKNLLLTFELSFQIHPLNNCIYRSFSIPYYNIKSN